MAIGRCIVLHRSKGPAVSVGTPCTRLTCHYCNRSCNSKSPEATIISIFLTDKVQPNIFVMVSHKVSCWPVKALQQSLVPAATQDRIQDLYAAQVPPGFCRQGAECDGRYRQCPLLGKARARPEERVGIAGGS